MNGINKLNFTNSESSLISARVKDMDFFKPNVGTTKIYCSFENNHDQAFRAIAIGFVDLLISHKLDYYFNKNYNALMQQYFEYFPHCYPATNTSLKAAELMSHLISSISKAELITTLAYVIRQLSVDIILNQPQHYSDIFEELNWQITPQQMRESQQQLPHGIMRAVAQAIKLPINIEFYKNAASIPVKISYNYSAPHHFNECEIYLKLSIT